MRALLPIPTRPFQLINFNYRDSSKEKRLTVVMTMRRIK